MSNLIQKLVFDKVGVPKLERLVDLAALRQKLLVSNIANATSPGYQRRDIDFQQELSSVLETRRIRPRTTRPGHLVSERTAGVPPVCRLQGGVNTTDVSEVDIDKEMGQLAVNSMNYDVGIKLLSKTFAGLRLAIRGRS